MRFRFGALLVLAIAAGVIAWLALRDRGSSTSNSSSNVTAFSSDQIANLAASVKHPVFWVGPRQGFTYELSRNGNGAIFIRYLPPGVRVGAGKPYLTVATYPFTGAFPALQAVSTQSGSTPVNLPHGGLAVLSSSHPENVHVAYPRVDYQVEVYHPKPGLAIVAARQLTAFGSLTSGPAAPNVGGLDMLQLGRTKAAAARWPAVTGQAGWW